MKNLLIMFCEKNKYLCPCQISWCWYAQNAFILYIFIFRNYDSTSKSCPDISSLKEKLQVHLQFLNYLKFIYELFHKILLKHSDSGSRARHVLLVFRQRVQNRLKTDVFRLSSYPIRRYLFAHMPQSALLSLLLSIQVSSDVNASRVNRESRRSHTCSS